MLPANLAPAQRFMYEYGCFASFWSNFELLMEVAIADLTQRSAKENSRIINGETAGKKKQILAALLTHADRHDVLAALQDVFDIAERNSWIHGHILNPNGDFSRLTRLRIEQNDGGSFATNEEINFDSSPFEGFYEAYQEFQNKASITAERCNTYIRNLQRA
jgi:hypothetical protein